MVQITEQEIEKSIALTIKAVKKNIPEIAEIYSLLFFELIKRNLSREEALKIVANHSIMG